MKKILIIAGAILLAAVIAAGSFWGGMAYQTKRANQVRANFMNARGLSDEGQIPFGSPPEAGQFQAGGTGFLGRGATGQIKTIEGNVITISTAQDVTTVNLSEATQIEKTVTGAIADLQVGVQVMITGERDDNGEINASQITILSDNLSGIPIGEGSPYPPATGTEP